MLMNVLSACIYVQYTHIWCPWGPNKALDPLEVELQMIVNDHVSSEN